MMDVFEQQKKLYSDPHFGYEKRGVLTKIFESVKTTLTPKIAQHAKTPSCGHQLTNSAAPFEYADEETYIIFRNGVEFESLNGNECACQVEVIALKKQYPQDTWTYKSSWKNQRKTAYAAA